MKKRMIYTAMALIAVLLSVGGCQYKRDSIKKEKLNIVFVPKTVDTSTEFWSMLIAGAEMAAKEYNVNLEILSPDSESDIEQQNRLISEAVDKKPDGIAIAASSYEKTAYYAERVKENNICLGFIDSQVEEKIADTVVSTDNYEAGYKLGRCMKKFVDENTHIALIGHVEGASTTMQRERGIRAGLGDAANRVEQLLFCDSVYQNAYDLTAKLLQENPKINMIAGLNEYSSVGMAILIQERNLQDAIDIFGFDSSITQIELLEAGVYKALLVQNSFNMGYMGIENLVRSIRGQEVEPDTDSGSNLVTKENMYTDENQKLLFPFIGSQATEDIDLKTE